MSDPMNAFLWVVAKLGGEAVVVAALAGFVGKIWANGILEQNRLRYGRQLEELRQTYQRDLEALKANLDATNRRFQGEVERAVFVSRAHFDAEFKSLMDIWERIVSLRAIFVVLEDRPRDRANDTAWFARIEDAYVPRLDALLSAVESQSPLYPSPLYERLSALVMKARVARTEATTETADEAPDYFRRRREFRQQFEAQAAEISDMIRERIEKLAIVRE